MSSVDGVESVRHEVQEISPWPTFGPITSRSRTVHHFFYSSSSCHAVLDIRVDETGETELEQSICWKDRTPSRDEIDAMRAIMIRIEKALESQCALTSLSGAVKETCAGVECPAK